MMTEFDGAVAVVTGGASGIGAATVSILVERGARVAILDRDASKLSADAVEMACDVTDSASVDRAISSVVERFGQLDIVVNNAGVGAQGTVTANSDDQWHRVFDVNVVAIARVIRAALPHLRKSEVAAVVNTCSVAASVGLPNRALYSASKGAVASLTLAMAADYVGVVRVNAVMPGTVDTPWVERILSNEDDRAAAAAALRARQPIGRLVTAAEVGNAIAYLASPLSGATTGTLMAVDGGMVGVRVT